MVEYGKTGGSEPTSAPPGNQLSLDKRLFAICGIAFLLIALGVRQCQGQKEQTASATGDERVKSLEEKIKRLESRAQQGQQAPMQGVKATAAPSAPAPKEQLMPQAPALSANDIDQYKRNINYQRGLIDIYSNSNQQFVALGLLQESKQSVRKMQIAEITASCLDRYKSAAEPFYKANTACLAVASNTPPLL